MMKNFLSFVTVAAAMSLAAPVMAATISGIVYEGGGPGIAGTAPGPADFILGDFSETVGDPLLTLAGDTQLYGGVTSLTNADLFTDSFAVDFGATGYIVDFGWSNASTSTGLDGELTVGGTTYALADVATINLGTLTGIVNFTVDPTAGAITGSENAYWNLQMAVVPIPAAGLLLLTALGGLGFARRRKAA